MNIRLFAVREKKGKMGRNWILGFYFMSSILVQVQLCDSQEQELNTYTISSFTYAKTSLKPYEWHYITVELPPWFSSMSLALESDVDLDLKKINNASISSLPMICIRKGSLPLPDVYNTSLTGLVVEYISNDSFIGTPNLQNAEKCYPMQKNISLRVTNEQISPGTWYFGFFNGIGPIRTQSKMINRGTTYFFSGNISIKGCATSMMFGQFCNHTVNSLSCSDSNSLSGNPRASGQNNIIGCRNADGIVCHNDSGPTTYSLDVMGIAEELTILASNVTFNATHSSNGTGAGALMAYARHGVVPLQTVFDFSGDISKAPMTIQFPKAGRWYITVLPTDIRNRSEEVQNNSLSACYLMEWQVFQCPMNKAGSNCTLEKYSLQTILRKGSSTPFESNYLPMTGKLSSEVSLDSPSFHLEPLVSNFSSGMDKAWTFFLLDVPSGATGNIHIHLTSDTKINYEIYARYGGLPSINSWDYFYANTSNSSNSSMFFKLYDSSEKEISFYMLYVQEGTWSIGLRQLKPASSASKTDMSLALERCPSKCSSHGSCQLGLDISGLTLYSFCTCDRNHGGFDCGVELVSHRGHIRQSIFLIASNAAAVLPAYWALRNKAFAEWVLFTSSGISSGLYHACDVGTWCVMKFHVLQFLDFWLSFMAVASTFLYLTTISEVSKRTIHTIIAILTALLAETGPTKSSNIGWVIGIGTLGLLVGWLIEFCTHNGAFSFSTELHLNLLERWETTKLWIRDIIKTVIKRFRWGFILAGFAALALAAVSWKMESTESYWIWHSLWHVTIYTSSFLFLCSKSKLSSSDIEGSPVSYELTRQNSFNGSHETQI